MAKRFFISFFCSVIVVLSINAQINSRLFYSIMSNSYQDRQAFSILESNDGFMWFVNDYGISRYDGKQIKNYLINVGWRGFIKKNSSGDIYVCTSTGFGYKYNELTDSFDELFGAYQRNSNLGIASNAKRARNEIKKSYDIPKEISSMEIDQWGRIWISTYLGILCFDPLTKDWIDFDHQELNITYLLKVKDCLYLFGNDNISFIKLNKANQMSEKIHRVTNLTTNDKIISAYSDSENRNLYWGTFNKGLYRLNKKNEIKQLISISNSPVRSIKMYDRNILLIGIDGLGIYEYNIYSDKIEACQKSDDNKIGTLGSNGIYDIYVDSNKRIWVATYSKGVNVYNPNQFHFQKISHLVEVPNSLANNYINCIYEDIYKNIWFATNNGISIKKNDTGNWIHLLNNKSTLEKNSVVMSLCSDSKGDVWTGGYGFGIKSINPVSLSIKSIDLFKLSNEYINNYIFSITNQDNLIWASGVSNKLFSIDTKTGELNKFPISSVRVITIEDNNHLLLMSNTQILSFNISTGKIDQQLDKLIKTNPKMKAVQFVCLKRKDDNLWIGTSQSGVIRYSFSNNTIDVYNVKNGLTSNNILTLEIDNNDCVWLGTDEGLCYLNPVTSVVIPFKTQEGSEKGIFNYMSSVKLSNGTMIFGTKQGAISFNPSSFLVSPRRGLLAWTDFYIYNQNKDSRRLSQILEKGLNKCEEIKLHYHENSFRIGFQELNYSQSINTRYSYCLNGFDNEYTSLSNEGSASFYNIPPGKYKLIVRSYFADKEGKYIERAITIDISEPWWNTIWAWFIWIVLTAATGFVIYRYFKNRIDRRYSDEKTRFFINVSHDMRTPITLIKAPLGDLANDSTLSPSSKYLVHMINNNVNRLFDMINRILDFEKSDEEQMRLFPQEYELNQYVQEVAENFHSYAEIKGITISEETSTDPVWVYFDRIKMDMVVENLISNAIKYSKQGGFVKLIAGFDKKNWWIEVLDNGIGIPQNEQQKIFKRFFRAENAINSKQIGSGMGLLLVNNLTKFMGGFVSFESEEGLKTTFRVTFPLNYSIEHNPNNTHVSQKQNEHLIKNNLVKDLPLVLFVDDNDDIRSYISTRLANDYNIITASSADEALNILYENNVSIIISDIMMPEVSGIEFCEKIKSNQNYSHIPVILLSALSDKKDILKGLQIGADDYITKPFDSIFLMQRIENILENRKRLEQYFSNNKGDISELSKQSFVNELDKLFLDKLERIFESNISNPEYTIEILCRDIGMSRTVFYNRLKNLMNLSPNDYLRIKRMERAAELLSTHKYAVVEVAEMVGYTDVKYFSSLFTKKYGCAPSKYFG